MKANFPEWQHRFISRRHSRGVLLLDLLLALGLLSLVLTVSLTGFRQIRNSSREIGAASEEFSSLVDFYERIEIDLLSARRIFSPTESLVSDRIGIVPRRPSSQGDETIVYAMNWEETRLYRERWSSGQKLGETPLVSDRAVLFRIGDILEENPKPSAPGEEALEGGLPGLDEGRNAFRVEIAVTSIAKDHPNASSRSEPAATPSPSPSSDSALTPEATRVLGNATAPPEITKVYLPLPIPIETKDASLW